MAPRTAQRPRAAVAGTPAEPCALDHEHNHLCHGYRPLTILEETGDTVTNWLGERVPRTRSRTVYVPINEPLDTHQGGA